MKAKVGFAICGSFCTFNKIFSVIEDLVNDDYDVYPIMSLNACSTDTRFGEAKEHIKKLENLCNKQIITKITEAEPIGPQKLVDILVIAPCTGNTLGKLASGITDTAVTMATKSHLRNQRPVLIGVSTNDGLSASAKNIGMLLNQKNIFFIPMGQDDYLNKPCSIVADFTKTKLAITQALNYKQIQPILL